MPKHLRIELALTSWKRVPKWQRMLTLPFLLWLRSWLRTRRKTLHPTPIQIKTLWCLNKSNVVQRRKSAVRLCCRCRAFACLVALVESHKIWKSLSEIYRALRCVVFIWTLSFNISWHISDSRIVIHIMDESAAGRAWTLFIKILKKLYLCQPCFLLKLSLRPKTVYLSTTRYLIKSQSVGSMIVVGLNFFELTKAGKAALRSSLKRIELSII